MYSGRFAPSPTGPLHLGSLFAAVASWLDARFHQGRWILRIEDIDPPREVEGSADLILQSLEAHGLEWDGEVQYQSARIDLYMQHLELLKTAGYAYPCSCSRAAIARMGGVYDGRCRSSPGAPDQGFAWRFKMNDKVEWQDIFNGRQQADAAALADPVIWRRDGLVAYQLAVVVDDALMKITHVVRGADLLDSTAAQLEILDALTMPRPSYGHIPLVLGKDCQKLSKQNQSRALQNGAASQSISQVLGMLGQKLPTDLRKAPVSEQLNWARNNWDRSAVPHLEAIGL